MERSILMENDYLRIDDHKLMFHPKRVVDWLDDDNIYPIYMEISPSGKCIHRCVFCSVDFMGYKGENIEKETLLNFTDDMSINSLKSVMLGGEGEPLIHPDISEITEHIKKSGIDVALTTNGVLFDEKKIGECLPYFSWVKISLDAGSREIYSKVHGCKPKDFDTVVSNISKAVEFKDKYKLNCVIGIQYLLIPENIDEVYDSAVIAKKLGVDYFVVKPYTSHPKSGNHIDIDYKKHKLDIGNLSDSGFSAFVRTATMNKQDTIKPYNECLGYSFWSYLSSSGDVYPCNAVLGDKNYSYGNIYESPAREIYNGYQRYDVEYLMKQVDVDNCRRLCRLDAINCYLWELKHPKPHVNFI
jgi:radical SAM protein with 4Fe4S-binding SPASM domain